MESIMSEDWFKIFIYCDDRNHGTRRVAVTNFAASPAGWVERPASRAPQANTGTGRPIVNDSPGGAGWALGEVPNSAYRERFELRCRKCRRDPVVVVARPETLWRVLDGLRGLGMSEVALPVLAASLDKERECKASPPELGQG
jgi:hypothetical protein